eukprot:361850-Amphidinium_carterae.1
MLRVPKEHPTTSGKYPKLCISVKEVDKKAEEATCGLQERDGRLSKACVAIEADFSTDCRTSFEMHLGYQSHPHV